MPKIMACEIKMVMTLAKCRHFETYVRLCNVAAKSIDYPNVPCKVGYKQKIIIA